MALPLSPFQRFGQFHRFNASPRQLLRGPTGTGVCSGDEDQPGSGAKTDQTYAGTCPSKISNQKADVANWLRLNADYGVTKRVVKWLGN